MAKAMSFLAGIAVSGVAAMAAYKALSPEKKAALKKQLAEKQASLRDLAVDYAFFAADAVEDRHGELKENNQHYADLTDKAQTVANKAQAFVSKAQTKVEDVKEKLSKKTSEVTEQTNQVGSTEVNDIALDISETALQKQDSKDQVVDEAPAATNEFWDKLETLNHNQDDSEKTDK